MRKVNIMMKNRKLAVIALFAALSVGGSACGDDSAVSGGIAVTTGDAAVGSDGTLAGADGTTIGSGDAITMIDGVVASVCGNGKCELPYETAASCPTDCGSVVVGPDATVGPNGPVCGDGICQSPLESMLLCPADCKTPATDQEACKHKACQPQYDACSADAACVTAIKCFNAGGGNECYTSKQVQTEVDGLSQCVTAANCTAVCGNGQCEMGETELTCPADCKTAVGPQETCLQQSCSAEYTACKADASCVKIAACVDGATTQQAQDACFQGVGQGDAAMGLFQCGGQAGCFGGGGGNGGQGTSATCGNGTCDQGETMLTCPADCKQPSSTTEACYHQACPSQYAACSADPSCVKTVDCTNTGGTAQQCGNNANAAALGQCVQGSGCDNQGGGGPTTTCGNGICEPGELVLTCPADCKTATDPQETCLQQSCAAQYKACQADSSCVQVVTCVEANPTNPQQCLQGGLTGAVGGLFQCGQQANCFGGGGGGTGTAQTTCQGNCGNYSQVAGSCQCDNQCTSAGDCCKDYTSLCGTSTSPVCGDGTCSAPTETAANCPADCGTPTPVPCKTIKDCAANEVCCGLASGSVCTAVGSCN